jgi:CxxC motif-containing protein
VSGNQCPKGDAYAQSEIENPLRILTGTVLAEGLSLKMVPVRTDKPIPKAKLIDAAAELKRLRVKHPLRVGAVLAADFLGLGVNLIVTRGLLE